MPQYPHEQFHDDLVKALKSSGRTIAGLGAFLSAENDKDPRTNEQAVRRWFRRLPVQVIDLICLLDSIGLRLQIVPREAIGTQVESKSKPKESDEKWLN
jgi:hypothetical protein